MARTTSDAVVLAFNAGSSSLKFGTFAVNSDGTLRRLASGTVGRIGDDATIDFAGGESPIDTSVAVPDHRTAVEAVVNWLRAERLIPAKGTLAIGHRIVHGGSDFTGATSIDDAALSLIEKAAHFAPLHNPPATETVRACRDLFGPDVPMVATFDTAFYADLPNRARLYAIPFELAERHGFYRRGFHGLAHQYMARRANDLFGLPASEVGLVTLQLGNGCSATAVLEGRAIDTTMGFTPLEGLIMGTRSGDIDPSLVTHIAERENLSLADAVELLNTRSGLLGVSSVSSDMRDLYVAAEAGDWRAELAIEMFTYRVSKQIGAYAAAMGRLDGIVFGGGIGENVPDIRDRICRTLGILGVEIDSERNAASLGVDADITGPGNHTRVLVISVDEVSIVAQMTVEHI